MRFGDFEVEDKKTKLCIFALFYCFTSIKWRTHIKLVKSWVKFTVTMLYKNFSANDGSWNSVLVILISVLLLGQSAPLTLMTTKALIKSNPRYMTQEIAETLKIHHSSVHNHLNNQGYVSKLDISIPCDLTCSLNVRKAIFFGGYCLQQYGVQTVLVLVWWLYSPEKGYALRVVGF